MSQDLLCAQGDAVALFGGNRQGFVERIDIQRLHAAHYSRHGLDSASNDVIMRLLGGRGGGVLLSVHAIAPGLGIAGAEAFAHDPGPHPPGGPVFSDFLEEVVMHAHVKCDLRPEAVNVGTLGNRRFHVGHAIGHGQGQFLRSGGTQFAGDFGRDVDRDEGRHMFLAIGDGVGHQAHRAAWLICRRAGQPLVERKKLVLNGTA